MSRSWWRQFIFLFILVVFSCFYVYPTLVDLDPQKSRLPFKQKINLGLDLQGGLYLVLGIDFNKVYKDILDRNGFNFKDRLKEKNISLKNIKMLVEGLPADDPRVAFDFDLEKREEIYQVLKKEFTFFRLAAEQNGHFELGFTHEYRTEVRERTLSQSIEVIRNRIDEFGVSEPSITSQGNERIVVELPGVREIDRAKELIGRTAKLEFKRVDDQSFTLDQLNDLISKIEKEKQLSYSEGKEGQKFSEYLSKLNEYVKGKIPEDREIAFEKSKALEGGLRFAVSLKTPYLLHSKVEVTGDDLQDASVQIDPENRRPNVSFTLNARGASQFEKLTQEHIGHRIAIVLDHMVHSAPVVQNKIAGGKGQITLGRGDGDGLMKEAKDLAIILRAGALPAQLDFLEQRVVGPSLGQDSIHKGALASLIGSLVVFIFVAVYYKVSGVIAVFSLLLNVLFVLAALIGIEATLTLPGIAGIALTVGIAVDSNVVIYERIREELRAGKRAASAVEAGFKKAFRTIVDANVTNAAAAIVLLMYGTGPIKGFAITLLIGILTTLFTAVFVCRLVFDLYLKWLDTHQPKKLSI